MPATNHASPSEMEHTLTQHEGVAQAAVTAWPSPGPPDAPGHPRLVAYVVPASGGRQGREKDRIEEWQQIYERVYTASPSEPFGENFSGWDSSYDGRPIDRDHMRQWRSATVDRIRELRPRRVLEIGVGSGLLLSRLAADCETYWGTDFSGPAIEELHRNVKEQPQLADRVTLRTQAADDVDGLPAGYFDTIVINSVTQCFPSGDYLTRVITRALGVLAPGGAFFIGDVRDLRTLEYFHTAVALHRRTGTDAAALAVAAEKSRIRDEELLVHPGYFVGLPTLDPAIGAVDIQLQQSRYHNEMSRHRYDVVLHKAPAQVTDVGACPSLAWGTDIRDMTVLADRLGGTRPPLRITGIPNARIANEEGAWRALTEGDAVRARELLAEHDPTAVDPQKLTQLAADAHLHLALVPGPDRPGHFDVVFTQPQPGRTALAGTYRHMAAAAAAPLTENPAATHRAGRFAARLRDWLGERLPGRVLPAIVVVDALPLRSDGMPDVRALSQPPAADGTVTPSHG
ncbi:methyltransferase [Streptomyces sp. NPDC012403]|uniref:methyltransferase n=1 Tax=Streptomyces sp. NPDC012403 TaxID=3364831 RepID=UPI0036E18FD2